MALSLEVQRPGREADHSPPSSDEVKSERNNTSTPPPAICVHGYTGAIYLCNVIQILSQVGRYRPLVSPICVNMVVNPMKFRCDNQ